MSIQDAAEQQKREEQFRHMGDIPLNDGGTATKQKVPLPMLPEILQLLEKRVADNAHLVNTIENKLHSLRDTREDIAEVDGEEPIGSPGDVVSYIILLTDSLGQKNVQLQRQLDKLMSII